jgi:predicted ATPase
MQDQSEPGLAQLRQGLEAMVTLKQERARPTYVLQLADANGHVGQAEEGWHLLAEALTAFEANGQGDLLAEAYRLQDALLLRQAAPDAVQVEACFQQALAIARRQQAKSWELRASVSLSRLWQQQGKGVEARQRLAEVYGWFTEGFDTVDLQGSPGTIGGAVLTLYRGRSWSYDNSVAGGPAVNPPPLVAFRCPIGRPGRHHFKTRMQS